MNKKLMKLMTAIALCGALCGTATAAPKSGAPAKGKAPATMTAKTPAPAKHVAKAPAQNHRHAEPARPAHRHEVARHTPPPPPPKHHEPRRYHDHHCDHQDDNWCVLGVSVIGGLVGSLISAAL